MNKKNLLLLLCTYIISATTSAQSFMHGFGANISILNAKINTEFEKSTFTMAITHVSYYPKYNLTESENSSLSIGSPLGAGIGFLNSNGGTSGIAYGFDLPVALDYNMGCHSTPDNEQNFGGYFGAGFGYMYTGWNDGEANKAISYGPLGRAGIRFGTSQGRFITSVGVYYKYGLETAKYKTFGFNVIGEF